MHAALRDSRIKIELIRINAGLHSKCIWMKDNLLTEFWGKLLLSINGN